MASVYATVIGTVIFIVTWVFLAFHIPQIPIGRTLATLFGAVLCVVTTILSPLDAFNAISLETIALLFGTMIISTLLQREGMFDRIIGLLTYRCESAKALLVRVCIVSGVMSALVTNDTVCVFLTPIVVSLCEHHQLPHGPFLIGLATSANIGSSLTPTGNPQNMIIASISALNYGQFLEYLLLATVVCLTLNIIGLLICYNQQLKGLTIRVCNAPMRRVSEEEMNDLMDLEKNSLTKTINTTSTTHNGDRLMDLSHLQSSHNDDGNTHRDRTSEVSSDTQSQTLQSHVEVKVIPLSTASVADNAKSEVSEVAFTNDRTGVDQHQARRDAASDPEDVNAIIRRLQIEHFGYSDERNGRSADDDNNVDYKRRSKTRIASIEQPRLRGRTLVMLPPKLVPSETDGKELTYTPPSTQTATHSDATDNVVFDVNNRLTMHEAADISEMKEAATEFAQARRSSDTDDGDGTERQSARIPADEHAQHDKTSEHAPSQSSINADSALESHQPTSWFFSVIGRWKRYFPREYKLTLFSLVLLGTLGAFVGGANLGWAAVSGATIMLIIDLSDPDHTLLQVDWSLLVFFCSLFIVVQGFQETDLPSYAWNGVLPLINVDALGGVMIYMLIILVGSNTVSNVPLVLILAPNINSLNDATAAWLLLAFVSTVAGNLTLVGSVANLIVAARAKEQYNLKFMEYFYYGFPSTLIITVIGVLLIKAVMPPVTV